MNYRHAFHAGNFADVMKHATLVRVLEHLKDKPKPFRAIDTHAGRGLYDLAAGEAERTGEWREGIGRIIGSDAAPLEGPAGDLIAPYLSIVRSVSPVGTLARYPGSPLILRRLLRPDDRLIVNESHPEDHGALARLFRNDSQTSVLALDGYTAISGLLPPKERRGVLLIDPPYEIAGEHERLVDGLEAAVRRFATGTVVIWYPIKDQRATERFLSALRAKRLPRLLMAELRIMRPPTPERLHGSGLVILNPPFRLHGELAVLLPDLATRLAQGGGSSARLDWLGTP